MMAGIILAVSREERRVGVERYGFMNKGERTVV